MNSRRTSSRLFLHCASVVAMAFFCAHAFADEDAAPPAENAASSAWKQASRALVHGPQTIALRDQAKISLPDGYGYLSKDAAKPLMESMGNNVDDRFLGLVVPLSDKVQWFVTLDYENAGYIKDDDAKKWNAKELLDNLKEGTEASNKHREELGIPPIVVTRWVESPTYDAVTHRLVWSAEAKLKKGEDPDPTINYNTYVLGREGYISLDLITVASQVSEDKRAANELLGAVDFNQGKRYTDFNSSTDKVAAYGLAALIGGIAAKKLGIIAIATGFFLKFAKLIALTVVGVGAAVKKFFKGKPATAE
jgi:uncharacterized membrane-anchored protein